MNRERILIVCCDGFENGGIQAVIMSIVRNLQVDFDFDAIVFSKDDQYYTQEFLKYGNIYHFPPKKLGGSIMRNLDELTRGFRYKKELKCFLKTHGPYDVIHCHNYFESAPFVEVAAKFGIPVRVVHSHNVAMPHKRKNPFYARLVAGYKRTIEKYATARVACSKAAGRYLFDDAQVQVINNAINLDKFDPTKYEEFDGRLQFIHVGRYGFQKNQLFLLDVFKNILKVYPQATLKLIGFGMQEQDVRYKIIAENLLNSVEMLPHDTNVAQVLSQSFAMIFPSTFEGLGISLIEAQAMGVRCYVSEAIQPEADLGLCKHLQLAWGAEKWAEFICNDIAENGTHRHYVDMSSYDIIKIANQYRELYNS